MARQPRKGGGRAIVIALVVVALLVALASVRFYTDVLWFAEVGFTSVLWTSIATQLGVGVAIGLFVAAVVWLNLYLAARIAPAYRIPRLEVIGTVDPLERYRDALTPYLGPLRMGIAAFVGLIAGVTASSGWQTFLLWANRKSFGVRDEQFERDVGFYVFELPFLHQLLSWLWVALFVSLLAALAAHVFSGSIRLEGGWRGVTSGALAHVSVLLGLLALVKAGQYWLGTYQLVFSERGVVTGASYTDVEAHLPALRLLAIISVVSALLFLINIRVRRLSLPLAAVALWIMFAVLAGGVWPWAVQRFVVAPQEPQREREYIKRNIAATRTAFGLDDVQSFSFPVSEDLTSEEVENNEALLSNVRLWDPDQLERVYRQLQAIRLYYDFEDVDIDRYMIDGEMRQVLLSPRELSLTDLSARSWSNLHLQYTHGYGVVASLANETTAAGEPEFLVSDLPGTVASGAEALEVTVDGGPALYYGEGFEPTEYSIVNSRQDEIDYPEGDELRRNNYAGAGGIPVSGFLRRLAFAIRERDPNLALSSLITDKSRILVYRNVRERVRRVAPFLRLDQDPYLAVVDGDLQWILDAYTSTAFYPYSQRFDMADVVETPIQGGLSGELNYVRNSVKVVVDAYDGSMQLHVVEDEPLIRAWRSAFPNLFADESPSPELEAHFRYPEDLFKVQSEAYLSYHVTDAQNFYAQEDRWAIPVAARPEGAVDADADGVVAAPTGEEQAPATYLLAQLPGADEQEFVLTRPFTPTNKRNMIAFMAAKSDPDDYGELLTLDFPSASAILGPSQIYNKINQDVEISRTLSLLNRGGSSVEWGSLIILPIEDSILYVQPLYVSAEEDEGIPELKQVVTVFGQGVFLGDSFDEVLAETFDLQPEEPEVPEGPAPPPPADGDAPDPRLEQVLQEASDLYDRAQAALERGDFSSYARLIEDLGALLEEAQLAPQP